MDQDGAVATTSSRTLRLLSLLQARAYWPGPELADRLGVSPRTLRRDVDRLRALGYPVRAARGVDGGYQLAPGASLPPLALDDEEAVALVVGLQTAVTTAPAFAEAALRALTKTVRVLPPRLRRQVDALRAATATSPAPTGPPGPDPAVLLTLAQAVQGGTELTLAYRAADGTASTRTLEPHRLVPLWRNWYLLAHDLDRGDWRVFRVDRVVSATASGRRFRHREPPEPDVAAYVRRRIDGAPSGYAVRAVLHCDPDRVRRRVGTWAQVADLPGNRCLLSFPTGALEWAAFELARADCEISEVEPPELVAVLREWSQRLDRATRGGG
jgi:predicted DNA-binding transcriptional regulator YafY